MSGYALNIANGS
jgi:hypothetical protein